MLAITLEEKELFNTIGLVARVDRKASLESAERVITYLEAEGLSILLEPKLARSIDRVEFSSPLKKMMSDLIITIGGDGTILRACLQIPKPEPPILAINMGVRGFLAEVDPKEDLRAVKRCLEGRYTVERYTKLASAIGGKKLPDALNEVFVASSMPAKLLYIRIWKGSDAVAECRADGIVAASQTGSTGYSLSGGGPVLDPEVDAFVLTPICPLTVFHPIVFSAESTISIELLRPKTATVVLDGEHRVAMKPKDECITIRKSGNFSSFIRFEGSFYHRLKGRLLFSRRGMS
ncbi:MAG: NAD(+)/NADH kinase [Candidatus Bathyarchaeota archaeon]|jgi:NAD+ kinase|nr:MAG: NAD(+)/NADH kinase [Candidatus Bathyarchaeota archaeon]